MWFSSVSSCDEWSPSERGHKRAQAEIIRSETSLVSFVALTKYGEIEEGGVQCVPWSGLCLKPLQLI